MASTEQPHPPAAATDELSVLTARRDALRARRDELARARRDEQAEAGALPVVKAAIAEARRTRDTRDSSRTRQHRGTFEQIITDVEAVQVALARVSRRVLDLELEDSDPLARRAERAQGQALHALQRFGTDLRGAAGSPERVDDDAR